MLHDRGLSYTITGMPITFWPCPSLCITLSIGTPEIHNIKGKSPLRDRGLSVTLTSFTVPRCPLLFPPLPLSPPPCCPWSSPTNTNLSRKHFSFAFIMTVERRRRRYPVTNPPSCSPIFTWKLGCSQLDTFVATIPWLVEGFVAKRYGFDSGDYLLHFPSHIWEVEEEVRAQLKPVAPGELEGDEGAAVASVQRTEHKARRQS